MIHDFKKRSSFELRGAVNKRIILWNEPVIEPSAYEFMKTLLGGDGTSASVKYQSDFTIEKTPVITSNHYELPRGDEAFESRIYYEDWKSCEHLRFLEKKPYSLAFFKLLEKFKVFNLIKDKYN